MDQVGIRLCAELRGLGIPVVGVERDPQAATARPARTLGIPVMDGHGGDLHVLERLRPGHARAPAAVGSDGLGNVAVALAAHGVAPHIRVVLRARGRTTPSSRRARCRPWVWPVTSPVWPPVMWSPGCAPSRSATWSPIATRSGCGTRPASGAAALWSVTTAAPTSRGGVGRRATKSDRRGLERFSHPL
ncbi:NAD-binding protein [Streptomyces sp. NBC_00988]|uniref:NAD-binding protein n=1 Tax=Streptomyces sp. NBC_00988 TaxID=2903704 RepID=UPI0038691BC8